MTPEKRQEFAKLLEVIADDPQFDESKYCDFERLLRSGPVDKLLGAAADALTEYYVSWKLHLALGTLGDITGESEVHRENLRSLAKRIRGHST